MKRFITLFLATLMSLFSLCCVASAANNVTPYSSFYLSYYSANILAGKKSGEIKIDLDLTASKRADTIGVSKIVIHNNKNNSTVTIIGTTQNGLLKSSSGVFTDSYSYQGISGVSYYADVTFYAASGGSSDSYTLTTNTVTAP